MANIALYPGGYKPPHIGHYKAAKIASQQVEKVIVFVGPKERESITQDMSVKLWELYTQGENIEIRKANISPVRDVYDFVELEAKDGDTLFFIKGEKDNEDPRFVRIPTYAKKFNKKINIEFINIPDQTSRTNKKISGTLMRSYIKNDNKEFFIDGLPLNTDEKAAWNIVTNLKEDLYHPDDHYRDFAKTNDPNPKKLTSNNYKYRNGGIGSALYRKRNFGEEVQNEKGKILHVYDFDDTIAKVKTNIKTVITSPTDPDFYQELDISSEEFPTKSKELEARLGNLDITYDFKNFEKQIRDAIINTGVVSKLKNSLSKTEVKTTILTARSIGHPVTRYMREELGLDAYVVPLGLQVDGKVTGQDKANWIENHIKKGYQTIYFIDDSEENRTSVSALKDKYPDIFLKVEDPASIREMMGTMNNQEKAKHSKNLKRLKKDLKKQGDQYIKVPDYLKGTLTRKLYEISFSDDVINSFNIQDTLVTDVWENNKLKPEIRKKLLLIAQDFFESLELPKNTILKDIKLTGSLANYNWSKFSDVDLHLVLDYSQIVKNKNFARDYFLAKKSIWNERHEIDMFGYPVEVYVEDKDEKHTASGLYSVLNDKWINEPVKNKIILDKEDIKSKAEGYWSQLPQIKILFNNKQYQEVINSVDRIKERLRNMRSSGLEKGGEYSVENLAFKVLRRTDFILQLNDLKTKSYDTMMSLNESTAVIHDKFIPLEVMDTPELQVQGMMGRNELEGGMIFPYLDIAKRQFHMQNCKIPLDIVFIDNNKINKIDHSASPCKGGWCPKYTGKADTVLELPGGYCKNNNVNVGDYIGINYNELPDVMFNPINEVDPKKGTGKKPKGSGRRLYTDENPKDTVKVKFSTRQDIVDTLTKKSFKSKSHARQSQIINLIHQRVRAALGRTKDPQKKKRLKSAFEYIKKRKEASKKKTQRMKKEGTFTKAWWKEIINETLLTEGGAAGHMAHPFNLSNVNSGKDLLNIFEKTAESLNKTPGSVKIDGVNSSIRLVDLDGKKQFVMDRGSKKSLDVKGITKDDLLSRFGDGHGMVKVGGEVLDMFNEALPSLEADLKKLGAYDDPNILFNMEYVSGKTNVQDYGSNFIAIHGLNKIETKEVQGKRKMLTKRVSSEVSYDKSALESLLNNLKPTAKKNDFEVYGSVPTEMKKKPNFNAALSKQYTIEAGENTVNKSLSDLLNELNNIPEKDFIFMNVNGTKKKVGAVSKQVYLAILQKENIEDLFDDENDKQKAIEGFTTYLATEKLGDEILKVLDSPMGSVENHEGEVIRDKNIATQPYKITGKFILGGMVSDF